MEYVFKLRLVGQQVQIHTLLVFFVIIGGLKFFGIPALFTGLGSSRAF
jgi:predicted PurR-regulated permease PerM